jgi:hypothetical protein
VDELSTPDALRRIGAWGLPSGTTTPFRPAAPDELLLQVDQHLVTGHALAAVDAGLVDVGEAWRAGLARRHLEALHRTLLVEAVLVEAVELLGDAGVRCRVLKGGATAHLDHADPALRSFRDADILVPAGQLAAAGTALARVTEAVPTLAPPTERWGQRFGKELAFRHREGVEVDVHQYLVSGYFGLAVDGTELFEAVERFTVAGRELVALDGPGRLVHAALHAGASSGVGLHSARDVAQLALVSEVGWEEAVRRCRRWHVDGLFALGVLAAWARLGLADHPFPAWARAHRPDRRQRAALALAARAGGDQRLSGPLALGPHRWPGYLGPLLRPDDAHLVGLGRVRGDHWRTGLRKLLRRPPGGDPSIRG